MDTRLIARGGVPVKLDRERIVFFNMEGTWLLVQKYGINFVTVLYDAKMVDGRAEVELKDMEALAFFLWVGLRADAADNGEDLTIERVREFITPYTLPALINAVVLALTRDLETPERPGKENATGGAAKPAVGAPADPGRTLVSASKTRQAGPAASRTGRQSSSGRRR